MDESHCSSCGHLISSRYCGNCGRKFGGEFSPLVPARAVVEAPLVLLKVAFVALRPMKLAVRIHDARVDLVNAAQAYVAALAITILALPALGLQDNERLSVLVMPGATELFMLLIPAFFWPTHMMLQNRSNVYQFGPPFAAFLIYMSLNLLVGIMLHAASLLELSDAVRFGPILWFVVFYLCADCLSQIYDAERSVFATFLILAFGVLIVPYLIVVIILLPVVLALR
jgi:hypothetical protein